MNYELGKSYEALEKKWVRMQLTWTNQKGDLVAEGEALVMPPQA